MSINLSNDEKEMIVGTVSGKMYRVLTADLSFMLHSDAHSACINDVSFGQDSNTFAAIDESGALKVWDLSEYRCNVTLMPAKAVGGVSCHIARDEPNTIVTGWRDGSLRCFDYAKRAQVWEIS
jgi:WD40 repeat protein